MAEALARQLLGPAVRVQSAGPRPTRVHPLAVEVMKERGMDLSGARAKTFDDVNAEGIETVVTLCAEEVCPPLMSGARQIRWLLPDPELEGLNDAELLTRFRDTRDRLEKLIRLLDPKMEF